MTTLELFEAAYRCGAYDFAKYGESGRFSLFSVVQGETLGKYVEYNSVAFAGYVSGWVEAGGKQVDPWYYGVGR
jgi:hypothetical protein